MNTSLLCPLDQNEMQAKVHSGTNYFQCLVCTGHLVLIDSDQILQLRSTLKPSPASVMCPFCKKGMLEYYYKNIEIDLCLECPTVWLDPGEFSKIIGLSDKGTIKSESKQQLASKKDGLYFELSYPDNYVEMIRGHQEEKSTADEIDEPGKWHSAGIVGKEIVSFVVEALGPI